MKRITVLLAEDHPINRKFATRLLERAGHSVILAEDGRKAVASWESQPVDLILTGCQAIDDLDGLVGPLVAQDLGFPYVGIVTGLDVDARGIACCSREYPGGVHGSFELDLPAVVGIQGAEKPPRYVPIAKVRAAMAAGKIEVVSAPGPAAASPIAVVGMKKPEVADRAEMITGSLEEIATRVCEILAGRGLL